MAGSRRHTGRGAGATSAGRAAGAGLVEFPGNPGRSGLEGDPGPRAERPGELPEFKLRQKFTLPACFHPLDLQNHPIQLINQQSAGPYIAERVNERPVVPQNLIAGSIETIPKSLS